MKTIEQNGKIKRVSDLEAFKLIEKNPNPTTRYLSKHIWKTHVRDVEKASKAEEKKAKAEEVKAKKDEKKKENK